MVWQGQSTRIATGAAIGLLLLGALSSPAQEPGWIQDDLPAAMKQAKQSGNPIFIIFR